MRDAAHSQLIANGVTSLLGNVRQQTIELRLDHLIALAAPGLEARTVENGDLPAAVTNHAGILQFARVMSACVYRSRRCIIRPNLPNSIVKRLAGRRRAARHTPLIH
jgi:hypothetical protein